MLLIASTTCPLAIQATKCPIRLESMNKLCKGQNFDRPLLGCEVSVGSKPQGYLFNSGDTVGFTPQDTDHDTYTILHSLGNTAGTAHVLPDDHLGRVEYKIYYNDTLIITTPGGSNIAFAYDPTLSKQCKIVVKSDPVVGVPGTYASWNYTVFCPI